jgi:transposase
VDIFGIGELTAARIIARVGNPGRFTTEAAFASYTGTAPIEISSGERHRHRLSRSGDRQLNSVIHSIAVCQAATNPHPVTPTTDANLMTAKPHAKPADV